MSCAVLSCVRLFVTLWTVSPPGSSVHRDFPGKNTGVGCHALLHGIVSFQGSNLGLPHCRCILYLLSHWGSQLLLLVSRFSRVQLCATHRQQPTRLHRPWDSPGKNSGVGCHFLLQCMKVKSESEVAQSCPTLRHPMDCSPPGSSVHGIFQAKALEWGAIAFSGGSQ